MGKNQIVFEYEFSNRFTLLSLSKKASALYTLKVYSNGLTSGLVVCKSWFYILCNLDWSLFLNEWKQVYRPQISSYFFISFYGTTCRRRQPSDHTLNSRGPSRKQLKHLQSHHETWNFHSTTIKLILHHTMNYHHHETGTNILSIFFLFELVLSPHG